MRSTSVVAVLLLASTSVLVADTLVLTNGRRLQGELIGVTGREIEFEERDNGRRRTIRIPRADIARIEFESNDGFGRDDRREERRPDADPRGLRERSVNVTSREPWTDSGIDVRAGQAVYFEASGETRWGPKRRDGAAGENNSPFNAGRPLPDRPAAALIGKVGDGKDVFFIGGDPGPYRMRSAGRLYLGINDDVLTDNTGSLFVKVSY